jgi:type I restriction enzyme S subunit
VLFAPGDVLFGKLRPYLAKAYLADFEGTCSAELLVMRPRNFDGRFLLYWLLSPTWITSVDASTYGSKMPRASWEYIGHQHVPVPPLSEQRAAADFLDGETEKIDALVAKKQSLIELLQEKRTALISRAVTKGLDPHARLKDSRVKWLGKVPAYWTVLKLKRVSPVLRGASPRPIDDPKYFDDSGEYRWVRISDVTASDGVLRSTEQALSSLGASLSVKLDPGALFLSIAATIGKPCIAGVKCCIHDGFVYFPMAGEWQQFLYWVFSSSQPFRGLGKHGTQVNLNTDTVGDVMVALPPREEVVHLLDWLARSNQELEQRISVCERAIDVLEEYRSALITAAVTGQIDVRTYRREVS